MQRIDEGQSKASKKQPLHRHDFYYLLLLEKGAGTHSIDFEPYPVNDWTLFLMRPGQVHQHELLPGSCGWLIAFNPDFYPLSKNTEQSERLNQLVQHNHLVIPDGARPQLFAIVRQLDIELKERKTGYEEVIRSYLNVFFTLLYRIPEGKQSQKPSESKARLQELQRLIEKHLHETKKVSDYAEMMSLTVYQLNSITKSHLGKTGSELIADHVILEAKRQLLATNLLVSQVAFDLGYMDPAYFIRFFKKHTGLTPNLFREGFYKSAG